MSAFVLVVSQNNFGCCIDFESGEGTASIYSLEELQKRGIGPIDTLPFSIRILLEQALRNVEESKSNPCLLYTSPSPRDVEESRMPSSA